MREVRKPNSTETYSKRVHCKPLHLVVDARFEGALGSIEQAAGITVLPMRICADCFRGRVFAEVLAVVLDRMLDQNLLIKGDQAIQSLQTVFSEVPTFTDEEMRQAVKDGANPEDFTRVK